MSDRSFFLPSATGKVFAFEFYFKILLFHTTVERRVLKGKHISQQQLNYISNIQSLLLHSVERGAAPNGKHKNSAALTGSSSRRDPLAARWSCRGHY